VGRALRRADRRRRAVRCRRNIPQQDPAPSDGMARDRGGAGTALGLYRGGGARAAAARGRRNREIRVVLAAERSRAAGIRMVLQVRRRHAGPPRAAGIDATQRDGCAGRRRQGAVQHQSPICPPTVVTANSGPLHRWDYVTSGLLFRRLMQEVHLARILGLLKRWLTC